MYEVVKPFSVNQTEFNPGDIVSESQLLDFVSWLIEQKSVKKLEKFEVSDNKVKASGKGKESA